MADDFLSQLADVYAEEEHERRAKPARDLILPSGICQACGAHVALADVHRRWHDELSKAFESHVKAFEKIVEAAGLTNRRPRRNRGEAADRG